MHPELAGLFAACVDTHDFDNAPWLILADWLDEHDDPRGEFVRLCRHSAVFTQADRVAVEAWRQVHPSLSLAHRHEDDAIGWQTCRMHAQELARVAWHQFDWPTRFQVWVEHFGELQEVRAVLLGVPKTHQPWIRVGLNMTAMIYDDTVAEFAAGIPCVDQLTAKYEIRIGERFRPRFFPMPHLRTLRPYCANDSGSIDLSDLVNLPNLQTLGFYRGTNLTDESIPTIAQMTGLHTLTLDGQGGANLSRIRDWNHSRKMRCLCVRDAVSVEAIAAVATWNGLVDLELQNIPHLPNGSLDPLTGLVTLERINLSRCETPLPTAWVDRLAASMRLRQLNLASIAELDDRTLTPLAKSTALDSLDIRGNRRLSGRTLDRLATIPTLRWLGIIGCDGIRRADRERFRKMRPDCQLID